MEWPSLAEFARELRNARRSVVELTKQCLDAIEKAKDFNAVIEVNPKALERAKAVEKSSKKGKLYGVPFLAKDNFLTNDTHTTASSNILKSFKAPFQATAIERLEAEGAVLLGKTNLDAFAHGSSTENSDFGPTKNPVDPARVPGGSSGGSAAAVALGLCAFAVGTDTGGSIRQPAGFSGVVGYKPTYGLVSRYGVVAMASSTDVIGPLTRSVEDAADILDIMAGADGLDSTLIEREASYAVSNTDAKQLKIGLIQEQMGEGVEAGVREAVNTVIKKLKASGAKVEEVSIPVDELALAAYYVAVPAEISSNLARYDGIKYGFTDQSGKNLTAVYKQTRSQGFNAENKRRILIGTYVLSSGYYDAYYKKAQSVRTQLIEQYQAAFKKFDFLVGPTSPTTAFKIGEKQDPLSMYLADVMTVGPSLVGIPTISIPAGEANGLPVGMQIMAPQRHDSQLLAVAKSIEKLLEAN